MYAIIQTGGKQYKAEPGAMLKLEKLSGEVGEEIRFDEVLMVADGEEVEIGRPFVEGKSVHARIVEHGRGPKITVYKYKRRKDYSKKQGHRQDYTAVHIEGIGEPVTGIEAAPEIPEVAETFEE